MDSLNYTGKRKRRVAGRRAAVGPDLERSRPGQRIHDMNIDGVVFPRRKRDSSRYWTIISEEPRTGERGGGRAKRFKSPGSRCVRVNEKKIAAWKEKKNRMPPRLPN